MIWDSRLPRRAQSRQEGKWQKGFFFKDLTYGMGKMDQWLRTLGARPEDHIQFPEPTW